MRYLWALVVLSFVLDVQSQPSDSDYVAFRQSIAVKFKNLAPGKFGHAIGGIFRGIQTDRQIMALTFDACGGPTGSGYDRDLIDWLKAHQVPATLFLTGSWIDANPDLVKELSQDSLFEIENHGTDHCPCSMNGSSKYGIRGTENVSQIVDEIELNARKIETFANRRPAFYRSGTATADDGCVRIARELGERIISYDLLSGDAGPETPAEIITKNLLQGARKGAIVIMHMNHPERNGFEALQKAFPEWQKLGYSFVKLDHQRLH